MSENTYKLIFLDCLSAPMSWLKAHFQRHRERKPWDFCWRITIEGLVVAMLVAFCLHFLGTPPADRDDDMGSWDFLFWGVLVAPVVETLIFQSFPVWFARECNARFSIQIVASVLPFFAAHALMGAAVGILAGLVGGFYSAFTYAHWREQKRWTAYWTTALSHAMHNGILMALVVAGGIFEGSVSSDISEDAPVTNHVVETSVTPLPIGKPLTNAAPALPVASKPQSYRGAVSGVIYYVESDGRHVTAFSSGGKILWHRDPFVDAGLKPYRLAFPRIIAIRGISDAQKWMLKGRSGNYIAIEFDSSQFGILDIKNGDFTFMEQR